MNTAIYVRVSTADQKTDSQLDELNAFCTGRGWGQPIAFIEKESGAKVSRPKLDQMMSEIRRGRIHRIVCYKLDRLGRSLAHLALILDEINRLGVSLICSSQGIDTSSNNPAGRLQLGVLMAVAEFERSLIRERVMSGIRAARLRGITLGRPRKLNKRLSEVLVLHRQGKGIREIGRALKMPPSSVFKILRTQNH